MSREPGRKRLAVVAMSLLALIVVCGAPFTGMRLVSPIDVFGRSSELDARVFWGIRLPRVCLAFLAGAGLAVSGMAFQAMFRNPLATPFTLGVSSGASLGAALYVRIGVPFILLGIPGITYSAFLGALLSIGLVYGLTRARRGFSSATMLLAGVAVSFFFSSLILFIQYMCNFTHSFRILRWLMGGLEVVGFDAVLNVFPFVVTGCAIILYLTHDLNLLMTGEDLAMSRGVEVNTIKTVIFVVISLMVGGVVAFCGPIGFVGMMAPHICRLVVGPEHRYLTPATVLFGGTFLTICDALSRTLIAPAEIPVGVITALLGGPFFLWLLLRRQVGGDLL